MAVNRAEKHLLKEPHWLDWCLAALQSPVNFSQAYFMATKLIRQPAARRRALGLAEPSVYLTITIGVAATLQVTIENI